MPHLSDLLARLIGVFIFVSAFMALTSLNSGAQKYADVVKQQLASNDVYSQDTLQVQNEIFPQNDNGDFIVDGGYVLSMLLNDVTVFTKIKDTLGDNVLNADGCSKFELDLETRLGADVYYVLKDLTFANPVVKKTGVFVPGENFPLENYVYIRGKYKMEHFYSDSGVIECLQFTRIN